MLDDGNEVWGYITKCRQLLMWQLTEEENRDLREVVFPALSKGRRDSLELYDRHERHDRHRFETLQGRLRDREYENKLHQVMHLYHGVVMEVCDWMIYNKEYFHLLIGTYSTFEAFASAVDAAIIDECRGIQSRVWTRNGMVELDSPIQTLSHSEPHSMSASPSTGDLELPPGASPPTPRATPTTANVRAPTPPKHVLTPALAALTHMAIQPKHHPSHHAHATAPKPMLSTPPTTPPEAKEPEPPLPQPKPDSLLFKPQRDNIPVQNIDILDDEAVVPAYHRVAALRGSVIPNNTHPLAPPIHFSAQEPRQLTAPAPRRATIAFSSADAPGPLAPPRPSTSSEARRGSTWELTLVDNYSSSSPLPPASPDEPLGPTFEIATPFFTPSRAPTPQPEPSPPPPLGPTFEIATPFYTKSRRNTIIPSTEPASPDQPLGPTFEISTPFFKPSRAPGPESPVAPMGPTFPISTPFWTYATRAPRHLSPEPDLGPTYPVNTPLFTYSSRKSLADPEPASPDEPMGPTFEVATPLFTYAKRAPTALGPKGDSPEGNPGPTFPISTPLWNPPFPPDYSLAVDKSQSIEVPGVNIIAPSIASSKLGDFGVSPGVSPLSDGFNVSPKSEVFAASESFQAPEASLPDKSPFPTDRDQQAADQRDPGDIHVDVGQGSIKSFDSGSFREPTHTADDAPVPVPRSPSSAAGSPKSGISAASGDSGASGSAASGVSGVSGVSASPSVSVSTSPRSKKRAIFWDREIDISRPHTSHTSHAHSAHSAHASSSSAPSGTPKIRPMSSSGSLQHQWWKIRSRRNSTHSQD